MFCEVTHGTVVIVNGKEWKANYIDTKENGGTATMQLERIKIKK